LNVARGLLTDIQKSPYRDRIFVVLDAVHGRNLPNEISQMGLPKENIVVWSKNGIEYLYPSSVIDKIYGDGPELRITDDEVMRNGVSYKKGKLVEKVIGLLEASTQMHPEFSDKLLKLIESTI
jgi:hypothetical protein